MTWFDCMVIGMLSVSTILAYIRGVSRELSTLIALGAAVALIFVLGDPINIMLGVSANAMLSIITTAGFFCLLFISWLLLFDTLLVRFLGEGRGRIDRFFGAIFGAIRGFFLVGLSFLIIDYYFEVERRPDSIANATTLRLATIAGSFLQYIGLETYPAQPQPDTNDTPPAQAPDAAIPTPPDMPLTQEETRTGYVRHMHEIDGRHITNASAALSPFPSIAQEPLTCL